MAESWLIRVTPKYQRGIGAAETETVGQHGVQVRIIPALAHDGHTLGLRIQVLDIGGRRDKAVLLHQQ